LLRELRWEKEAVRELGLNPDDLPPRDRQRFWYSAIALAGVDTQEAARAADKLTKKVTALGYQIQ
jgi:hypothetical protein